MSQTHVSRQLRAFCLMLVSLIAFSMGEGKSFQPVTTGIALSAGLSVPVGDFSDDRWSYGETDCGFAGPGIAAGGSFFLDLGSSGLSLVFDLSMMINSVDEDAVEDQVRKEYSLNANASVDADASFWWLNVPALVGPRYRFGISRDFSVFVQGLVGASIVKVPDLRVKTDYVDLEYEYDFAVAFAIAADAGITIRNFIISVRFLAVPDIEADGDEKVSIPVIGYSASDRIEKDTQTAAVSLSVGYRF